MLVCKYGDLVGRSSPVVILHLQHTPSMIPPPTLPHITFPKQSAVPILGSAWVLQHSLQKGWISGLESRPPIQDSSSFMGLQTCSSGMHDGLGLYPSACPGPNNVCVARSGTSAYHISMLACQHGAFPFSPTGQDPHTCGSPQAHSSGPQHESLGPSMSL